MTRLKQQQRGKMIMTGPYNKPQIHDHEEKVLRFYKNNIDILKVFSKR